MGGKIETKGMPHSFILGESEEEEDCRAERVEEKVAEKVISRSEVVAEKGS